MKMTNSTWVKQFCEKNPNPDQNYCPRITIFKARRSNKKPYLEVWHNDTGTIATISHEQCLKILSKTHDTWADKQIEAALKQFSVYEQYNILYKGEFASKEELVYSKSRYLPISNIYAKYHARKDCLEIGGIINYFSEKYRNDMPSNWEWDNILLKRLFIFRGDPNIYTVGGEIWEPTTKYFNSKLRKYLVSATSRLQWCYNQNFIEMGKFAKAERYKSWDILNKVYQAYKVSVYRTKETWKDQVIEETNNLLLSNSQLNDKINNIFTDIIRAHEREGGNLFQQIIANRLFSMFRVYSQTVSILEQPANNILVARILIASKSDDNSYSSAINFEDYCNKTVDLKWRETGRIYFTPKGNFRMSITQDSKDTIDKSYIIGAPVYSTYNFINLNSDTLDILKKHFFKNSTIDLKVLLHKLFTDSHWAFVDIPTAFYRIFNFPLIETFIKSGYYDIARMSYFLSEKEMKEVFTPQVNYKRGNLSSRTGFNKQCLKILDESLSRHVRQASWQSRTIQRMKAYFDKNGGSIKGWNTSTFSKYYNFADYVTNSAGNRWLGKFDSITVTDEITEEERKLFERIASSDEMELRVNTFNDSARTFTSINRGYWSDRKIAAGFEWVTTDWYLSQLKQLRSTQDFVQFHDLLVNIYNQMLNLSKQKETEYLDKKYAKRLEDLQKYEKVGNDYLIVLPKSTGDLVREGSYLSHCVGSYTDRVAGGETCILFLRKASNPELPFYTIEVRDNRVIQIHGNNNRWLGNNPEAIPFVLEWLKEHNITFERKQLLNKGMGYGASPENLDGTPYGL